MIVDLYSKLGSWYLQDSYLHGPSKVVGKCDPFPRFLGGAWRQGYSSGTKSQRFCFAYKVYRSALRLTQMWKQLSWSFHESDSGKIAWSSMWKKIEESASSLSLRSLPTTTLACLNLMWLHLWLGLTMQDWGCLQLIDMALMRTASQTRHGYEKCMYHLPAKCTVEPLLTDTPQQQIWQTILKVFKQPLKSGHTTTPYT